MNIINAWILLEPLTFAIRLLIDLQHFPLADSIILNIGGETFRYYRSQALSAGFIRVLKGKK